MRLGGLSLDQAPPLAAPVRFFLTAPLFGIAAGLWLMVAGPELLASRWLPQTLAATHLLTLGVLAMVMLGALLQMLPVVVGAPVAEPVRVARRVHAGLSGGTLALVAGLATARGALTGLGALLLLLALGRFLWAAAQSLAAAPRPHAGVIAMRLALAALALTLLLGLLLALGHLGGGTGFDRARITPLHVGWGLYGWVALLLVGVAYQVVPMFQMTPEYPPLQRRALAPAMVLVLLAGSVAGLFDLAAARAAAEVAGALLLALFAGTTLWLQHRRRRRAADVTLDYWRLAMAALTGWCLLWVGDRLAPGLLPVGPDALLLGLLFVVGFALSAVSGMLYKIVPFLVWFHLQSVRVAAADKAPVPTMRELIAPAAARGQFRLHGLALALLLAALWWPPLAHLAGLAWVLALGRLGWLLAQCWRRYRAQTARGSAGQGGSSSRVRRSR